MRLPLAIVAELASDPTSSASSRARDALRGARSPGLLARLRLSILLLAVFLAGIQITGATIAYRNASEVVPVLVTGQAEGLLVAVRNASGINARAGLSLDEVRRRLALLLDAEPAGLPGLRYIYFSHPTLEGTVEVGQRISTFDQMMAFHGDAPAPVENRYLMVRPPGMSEGRQQKRRFVHAVEFLPTAADDHLTRARSVLLLSVSSAFVLVGAGFALFWLIGQRERARVAYERRRQLSALGEMSAIMAHELRNPLASAKGHAQLLAEFLDSESRPRAKAETVVAEIVRLEQLSNQLLAFVRSGQVERRPYDPSALANDVVESIGDPRVELDISEAPRRWSLDPIAVTLALENLVRNALQATEEDDSDDRRIQVCVERHRGRLRIAVRDHGPGFPEDVDVLEPFVTTRSRGTGLGLSVAREIAEAHGGTLHIANPDDGGALVEMTIPARG